MNSWLQHVSIRILLYAGLVSGLLAQTPPANVAWQRLLAKSNSCQQTVAAPDLSGIVRAAKDFIDNYPADERAKTARRISLSAQIMEQEQEPALSQDLLVAVEAYLGDRSQGVRDRLRLRIDLEQAKLRRRSGETISQAHHARVVHARELIREFPGEPEGYGLLLALAKTGEPAIARHLAGELLASPAPENFKAGAQRVLGRLELLGRRLRFAEADAAITGARGKPLIVYSWTAADEGFLRIIRQHAKASDVALVGVNLDVDIDSAKAVATTLPGTQYFDGAGLDGPRARQLCLLFRTSLYLVDEHGIVREVDGQNHPEALFAGIAARKRGAR